MNPFEFFIPQNITVGAGTLAKLPECAKKLGGSHAMLISGPTLRKMGVVDKAADYLKDAGMAVDIFTDVEANPSVTTVEKATEAYKDSGADFIVALGGGSPMDVAKAVGVTAKYGGSITEYEGAHKVPGKIVPLIAIPTTAGTGSEVTAFSVITDHSRDYKLTVFSYELLPAYAILDPELLTSAPASVAAACGIDAFIHAEEAYVSTAASPFSDAMAEKAMELIGGNIRCFLKLAGTDFQPDFHGKILLLEAMGGGVPQMITFLSQLKMMHAFEQINGILLGTFSQMERDHLTPDMPQLVRQFAGPDLAIARTLYIGHGTDAHAAVIGRFYQISSD